MPPPRTAISSQFRENPIYSQPRCHGWWQTSQPATRSHQEPAPGREHSPGPQQLPQWGRWKTPEQEPTRPAQAILTHHIHQAKKGLFPHTPCSCLTLVLLPNRAAEGGGSSLLLSPSFPQDLTGEGAERCKSGARNFICHATARQPPPLLPVPCRELLASRSSLLAPFLPRAVLMRTKGRCGSPYTVQDTKCRVGTAFCVPGKAAACRCPTRELHQLHGRSLRKAAALRRCWEELHKHPSRKSVPKWSNVGLQMRKLEPSSS